MLLEPLINDEKEIETQNATSAKLNLCYTCYGFYGSVVIELRLCGPIVQKRLLITAKKQYLDFKGCLLLVVPYSNWRDYILFGQNFPT